MILIILFFTVYLLLAVGGAYLIFRWVKRIKDKAYSMGYYAALDDVETPMYEETIDIKTVTSPTLILDSVVNVKFSRKPDCATLRVPSGDYKVYCVMHDTILDFSLICNNQEHLDAFKQYFNDSIEYEQRTRFPKNLYSFNVDVNNSSGKLSMQDCQILSITNNSVKLSCRYYCFS